MKKLILFVLLALIGGLLVPATRARILELAQPVIRPVLNPFRGLSAKGEMERIARDLETDENLNRELPTPREFRQWVRTAFPQGGGDTDPWGYSYSLRVWVDSFAVVSPGPDGQPGTEDDIRVSKMRGTSGR